MKRFKLFASMIFATALVVFGASAPSHACGCVVGAPTMTLTTSEVAGRIQVELVDEASQGSTDVVKYYITIYSDAAKTNVVSDAPYFEDAGTFLTQELSPGTEYWVEARKGIQNSGDGGWWMSSDSVIASAVTGAVSEATSEVLVTPSKDASSLHISISDESPETWYHIEISGSEDFAGVAWQHTTSVKELDVELPALQNFFVRVQKTYWDDVKKISYPIGLAAVSSGETSASISDARLGALFIEGVELNEPFSPDVFSYTASVPTKTESISISAAALNPNSAMTLGKNPLSQKEMSPVELSYEGNYVVVDVTSVDETQTKQYLILVNRQVPENFYIKGGVVTDDKTAEASGEVKRTLTGSESDDAEQYVVDTTVDPEPTQMPSTGGEESQSGAAPMDDKAAAGDSSASVWIFSSVAVLLLAGLGIGLARRRRV